MSTAARIGGLFLASLIVFAAADLRGWELLSALLRPAFRDPESAGWLARLGFAAVAAFVFAANAEVVRLLPKFIWRVMVVWAELLILFLLFFHSFDLSYEFIGEKIGFLIARGVTTTILISLVSIALACVMALVLAMAKMSPNSLTYGAATFYISFFRGLPLLMTVYLIYIGLPQLGFVVDAIPAGIAALSICYSAYMAEIFRAGIQSIPRGQWEAAGALGVPNLLTFRKIIMPQALKVVVPPIGNQFIQMLKDSALVSVVGVWELTFLAKTQGRSEFKHLEMLITAALLYWALSIVFELIQAQIEKHYAKSTVRRS